MNWVDILVVVLLSIVVLGLVFYFVLKKAKGQPLAGCDCSSKKGQQIVKEYHAQKAQEEKDACPYCKR
jgi:flagellar basal body-associated protein FliL